MMGVENDGSTTQYPGSRGNHDAHRAAIGASGTGAAETRTREAAARSSTAPPSHMDLDSGASAVGRRRLLLLVKKDSARIWLGRRKGGGQRGQGGNAAAPVDAAKAIKGNIGVYVTGLGAVTPIYTVTVKTRVDGQLMSVQYKEGDIVHKGDQLAEIDPRPYQAR